ncbi:MAG: hypothetical protein J7K33_08860, partial [Candidatus Marinimicrobia bacterium]|nr:hypothetical protein [Candidatus Neomarinimicrobiota bacterium]
TPIMVKVVMNTATEATAAPPLRRDTANGKEIKEGICKNDPNNATIKTPPKTCLFTDDFRNLSLWYET